MHQSHIASCGGDGIEILEDQFLMDRSLEDDKATVFP